MGEHDRRNVIFSLGSVLRRGNMLTLYCKSDVLLGVSVFLMCYPSFRNLVSGYDPVSPHWIPLVFFGQNVIDYLNEDNISLLLL